MTNISLVGNERHQLLRIKTNRRSFEKDYWKARNCCSWCGYVLSWV